MDLDPRDQHFNTPDAILARAAQSLDCKRHLGLFLGCPWEYVDENLIEALVEALRRLPSDGPIRRDQDRTLIRCVARLYGDVPRSEPKRRELQVLLTHRQRRCSHSG